MHEMGIALQLIDIAIAAIPADMTNVKVEAVNIRVGKLTAVVPDSLRFCFDIASQDTCLAGARLNIEEVPIEATCRNCGASVTIEKALFACGQCQSGRIDVVTGRELMVTSLELADPSIPDLDKQEQ